MGSFVPPPKGAPTSDSEKPQLPAPIAGFEDFGHVPLASVPNCRDLGGLPTTDGRRIAPGRLIRSSALNRLTEQDADALLEQHGLARVLDLRTPHEVNAKPDLLGWLPSVVYVFRPVLVGGKRLSVELAEPDADPFALIEAAYRASVKDPHGQQTYARFLDGLLRHPTGATLWHCTQGKDRAGLAAVLVEYALGVAMDDIRADYLATNLFEDLEKSPAISFAYPRYLDAALDAIDTGWGSLDGYLTDALGFDPEKRARLRELYLE